MQRIFMVGAVVYLAFFALLFNLLVPIKSFIKNISLGFLGLIVVVVLLGISKFLRWCANRVEYLKNKVLRETMLVYAFIWMIIIMVLLNDFPKDLFVLAD